MKEAEQNRFSMNLADRRLQLQRYRSRRDNIDPACLEDIAIRPLDVRICEKGYLAYAFRNASGTAHCFQVIRLPSTCGGVTRREWVLDIDVPSPDAAVLGMTLQPELDLLVIVESFQQRRHALPLAFVAVNLTPLGTRALRIRTIRLSDGQPHPSFPRYEAFYPSLSYNFHDAHPIVTRFRLAMSIRNYRCRHFYVYDLLTGQLILVRSIQSPPLLKF